MNDLLCIYHGNCADGFTAAWVVRAFCLSRRMPVQFHPGVYQDAPPDVTGRHVLMVDFSYKRPVLLEMAKVAKSIVILDHHKTAADDLSGFREPAPVSEWPDVSLPSVEGDKEPIAALFDMSRSGAGIAWDFFFGTPRHPLVNHVEDRDLWRFKLPHTREIQAAIFSYPYEFEIWDKLADSFDSFGNSALAVEGAAIERKHFKDINELIKVVTRRFTIGGFSVPVANLPYTLTSDAGHALAQGEPFAGCYWDTPDGRVFSLRSTDDGMDVSEIAKQYGGGGHRNASGFRVPYGHELAP